MIHGMSLPRYGRERYKNIYNMKPNNWMLAFASVIALLLLMRVTEKNLETKSIYGCGK